jgi:hypothetical protein
MCLGDEETYTTRTYVASGARYSEEYSKPRYGMSWRRRHGFGGSYYPSRYYTRPPNGRYMGSAVAYPNRYSGHWGYPGGTNDSQYNGYYSPYSSHPARYSGYSSGYGRYYAGARVAMPHHSAMVSSSSSFFLSLIALPGTFPLVHRLPHSHWLACISIAASPGSSDTTLLSA